jgi:hypothetical protein
MVMLGSWFPFSRAKIASRYPSRQQYLDQVRAAAQSLVRDRFMLPGDVARVMERGALQWDYAIATKPSPASAQR